ncbi:MAG: response regulator [Gammaproteobacteria bacterium]|nr:response regulator [Gammaproteobacteria bacterium]MDH5730429.1 response regulator [Gammaproteobacteria bacterium]
MGKKATILTVDDVESMRFAIKTILEDYDYEVLEAANGREALQVLETKAIDIFLVDINMPGMGGSELIHAIRSRPQYKTTPILMVTLQQHEEYKKLCKDLGATGWICKPFEVETIVETVQKFVA